MWLFFSRQLSCTRLHFLRIFLLPNRSLRHISSFRTILYNYVKGKHILLFYCQFLPRTRNFSPFTSFTFLLYLRTRRAHYVQDAEEKWLRKQWLVFYLLCIMSLINLMRFDNVNTFWRKETNWWDSVTKFKCCVNKVVFMFGLQLKSSKDFLMSNCVHVCVSIATLPGRAWNAAVGFNRLFG